MPLLLAVGYNLGLFMRNLFGLGKPRQWQDTSKAARAAYLRAMIRITTHLMANMFDLTLPGRHPSRNSHPIAAVAA